MKQRKLMSIGLAVAVSVLVASPAFPESGRFSIGAMGGWAWSDVDEAVEGFPETEFESSVVYGGSLMYRFASGFALELSLEHLEFDLEDEGRDFGTLNMTPLMLLFKYQGMPGTEKGLAGHAEIGGGINFTNFDKGRFIKDLERAFGVRYGVDTDDSFVFEVGAGLDYFFAKNFAIFLDGRFLVGNVDTSWDVSGPGGAVEIEEIDEFEADSFQVLVGARYWF